MGEWLAISCMNMKTQGSNTCERLGVCNVFFSKTKGLLTGQNEIPEDKIRNKQLRACIIITGL